MAVIYPDTLPEPAIDGNNMAGGPTFTTTRFDSGFRYRRSVDTPMLLSFSFLLTKVQMQRFLDLYYVDLSKGVTSFLATWEVNGFIDEKEFRFSKPFTTSMLSAGLHKVTAEFEMITSIGTLLTKDNIVGIPAVTYDMLEPAVDSGDNYMPNLEPLQDRADVVPEASVIYTMDEIVDGEIVNEKDTYV